MPPHAEDMLQTGLWSQRTEGSESWWGNLSRLSGRGGRGTDHSWKKRMVGSGLTRGILSNEARAKSLRRQPSLGMGRVLSLHQGELMMKLLCCPDEFPLPSGSHCFPHESCQCKPLVANRETWYKLEKYAPSGLTWRCRHTVWPAGGAAL